LRAAANAEDRQVLIQGGANKRQLELGSPRLDLTKRRDRQLVIMAWMDVKVSAADDKAIEPA
jgi:hypothetical protein